MTSNYIILSFLLSVQKYFFGCVLFFYLLFYHQLHSMLRFFHIGLHKRLSKSLQGRSHSSADVLFSNS